MAFDSWSIGVMVLSSLTGKWMDEQIMQWMRDKLKSKGHNDSGGMELLTDNWEDTTLPFMRKSMKLKNFHSLVELSFPKSYIDEDMISNSLNFLYGTLCYNPDERPSVFVLMDHKLLKDNGVALSPDDMWVPGIQENQESYSVIEKGDKFEAFVSGRVNQRYPPGQRVVPESNGVANGETVYFESSDVKKEETLYLESNSIRKEVNFLAQSNDYENTKNTLAEYILVDKNENPLVYEEVENSFTVSKMNEKERDEEWIAEFYDTHSSQACKHMYVVDEKQNKNDWEEFESFEQTRAEISNSVPAPNQQLPFYCSMVDVQADKEWTAYFIEEMSETEPKKKKLTLKKRIKSWFRQKPRMEANN